MMIQVYARNAYHYGFCHKDFISTMLLTCTFSVRTQETKYNIFHCTSISESRPYALAPVIHGAHPMSLSGGVHHIPINPNPGIPQH